MKRTDHQIVQEVLDGSISKEAFDGFQARLRGEPELIKLYGEYATLHHSLCEEFEDQMIIDPPVVRSQWTLSIKIFGVAAAALIALLLVIRWNSRAVESPAALSVNARFSVDAVWRVDGISRRQGDIVGIANSATLNLDQGQVHIMLGNAGSALIEGPAMLTVVSEDALYLASGRGRFRLEKPEGRLVVNTPSISATDLGTEFGIDVRKDLPDELHVIDGKVEMRVNGKAKGEVLSTGEAGRVSAAGEIERFSAEEGRFLKKLSGFKSIMTGRFVKSQWRPDYGSPSISDDRIDGKNYSVFLRLPEPGPTAENPVLMATLKVGRPLEGEFHTDGWAGMSFYSQGSEVLFFGDSFGPERTWSMDVKQRIPVVLPANKIVGPRTVTLRYDRLNGSVALHEGETPLGKAFCSGKIPPGLEFDEIRLGASSGAALNVGALTIRIGGGR
jgi:hypothetical protein